MTFRVPDDEVDSIAALFELSDSERAKLLDSLKEADSEFPPEHLIRSLSEQSGVDASVASGMLSVLTGLCGTFDRAAPDKDLESFIRDDVALAFDLTGDQRISPKGDKWNSMRAFLGDALTIDSLVVTAKAGALIFGHERILLGARLFTDIRPVFSREPSSPPRAAMLVHSLRIDYLENDEQRHTYFALDTGDLDRIKKVVERGVIKGRALGEVLERSGIKQVVSRSDLDG